MKIHTYTDRQALIQNTQRYLESLFSKMKTAPVLFLSSGGSSLQLLNGFNYTLGKNMTVGCLDERAYSDPAINNFPQLAKTDFYHQAKDSGVIFIDTTMKPQETKEEFADRYNVAVQDWFRQNPDGTVIATIGLGSDGHIAGMMPNPEDTDFFEATFVNTDRAIVGYDAAGKNEFANRVTLTIPYIKKITYPVAFFYGENKQEPWKRVCSETGSLPETPWRVMNAMEYVEVFCDRES